MMMAGPLHPPFSLFIPRIKRENGPCTVQKRKTRGRGLRGRGSGSGGLVRKSSDRGVVQAGVLFLAEWTSFSFCCRTPAFPLELRLPLSLSVSTASAAAESAAGPFADIQTPAKTEPRAGGFRKNRKHCLRVPRPTQKPITSFSLLDRARPVFSFSSGRKRENGGCNAPAIIMAESQGDDSNDLF
nr:hypothetical protein [uncultured Oscillibacter sp.]